MSLDVKDLDPNEDDFLNQVAEVVFASVAAPFDSGISLVHVALRGMLRRVIASEVDRVRDFIKYFYHEYKLKTEEFAARLDSLEEWQIELIRCGITGSKDLPNAESTPHLARLVYESIKQSSSGSDRFIYSIKLLSSLSKGDIDTLIYISFTNSELSMAERGTIADSIEAVNLKYREPMMFATYTTNLMSKGLIVPNDRRSTSGSMRDSLEYGNDLYKGNVDFSPTSIGLYIAYCLSDDLQSIGSKRIKYRIDEFVNG